MSTILTIVFISLTAITSVIDRFVKTQPWDRRLDWITGFFVLMSALFAIDSALDFSRLASRVVAFSASLNESETRLERAEAEAEALRLNLGTLDESLTIQGTSLRGISTEAASLKERITYQQRMNELARQGLAEREREIRSLAGRGEVLEAEVSAIASNAAELLDRASSAEGQIAGRAPRVQVALVVHANLVESSGRSYYERELTPYYSFKMLLQNPTIHMWGAESWPMQMQNMIDGDVGIKFCMFDPYTFNTGIDSVIVAAASRYVSSWALGQPEGTRRVHTLTGYGPCGLPVGSFLESFRFVGTNPWDMMSINLSHVVNNLDNNSIYDYRYAFIFMIGNDLRILELQGPIEEVLQSAHRIGDPIGYFDAQGTNFWLSPDGNSILWLWRRTRWLTPAPQ